MGGKTKRQYGASSHKGKFRKKNKKSKADTDDNDGPSFSEGFVEFNDFSFSRDDLLGNGANARVYCGTYSGFQVAIKELVLHSKASCVDFQREVAILMRLRHQNIVSFFGCSVNLSHCYIITELCQSNLATLIDHWAQG